MVKDGKTGLLYRKGDTAALASAISRVARDPKLANALGAGGRRFVEAERTWEATAAQVVAAYRRLT
jgi:glycosyltransferase involved in cell wall biosynthesis